MPVTPTYPGVYVQEVPSGVRTIVGVSTSTALFLGTSKKGAMFSPKRCLNYGDYVRNFGDDPAGGLLSTYVKLFFLNGGTDCYVMRLANGASASTVTLNNETGAAVLELQAKEEGLAGENIRTTVSYNTTQPESTFNIEIYRQEPDATGKQIRTNVESWKNLTMNPAAPLYAVTFLKENSKLIEPKLAPGVVPPAASGFSLSGRIVDDSGGAFNVAWAPLFGDLPVPPASPPRPNRFQISVGGSPYVEVSLLGVNVTTMLPTAAAIKKAIEDRFTAVGIPGILVAVDFIGAAPSRQLRITRAGAGVGDVFIRPASQADLAMPLMLGAEQGGLEISTWARLRPAPSAYTFDVSELAATLPVNYRGLALRARNDWSQLRLSSIDAAGTLVVELLNLIAPLPALSVLSSGDPYSTDSKLASPNGNSDGVREKLAIIAQIVNTYTPPAGRKWPWKAELWGYRLALIPNTDIPNFIDPNFGTTQGTAPAIATLFTQNLAAYSVGSSGSLMTYQTPAPAPASDGVPPLGADYEHAYDVADKQIDLFNLMVISPDGGIPQTQIYPNASVFCERRRAFLIMDPPTSWVDAPTASTGGPALRIGLSKQYSAVYYPRIITEVNGLKTPVGPSGALAGLYARTDATRGVWKAPAGTEADLRGITGVENVLSDGENGLINPRGINAIRVFPNGIVSWGARTNDGDDGFASEYKYIPIRRLALYILESSRRGIQWAVFEPNDAPLWAQLRLNVGSFMHGLFRQGAFQGSMPKDAYFVKCDAETTTQADRNLGVVNIWVGFAPLKPAEFVILYLQQMAGQIEV